MECCYNINLIYNNEYLHVDKQTDSTMADSLISEKSSFVTDRL